MMWRESRRVTEQPRTGLPPRMAEDEEWIAAACADIRAQQSWTFQMQKALAAIPAPTGNESTRGRAVQRALPHGDVGHATVDEAGNICHVVSAPGGANTRAPVVCMAHLDSVYAVAPDLALPIAVLGDAQQVHAPGIGDNGRGLAGLITLARVLSLAPVRDRLRRPVHLVATVGEEGEGNLRGARAWFDAAAVAGMTPFAAIAIDGPGDDTIVHHAVGAHRLRVEVRGDGGHSWAHAHAANPIHVLGEFIARAVRLGHARSREVVVHITRMQGGESLTAIPQDAWVDVDIRGTSATQLERVRRELVRLVHELTPASLQAELTVLGDRPAGTLSAEHPLVQAARRATEQVGTTPQSAVASTDANIPLSRGIPAIAIGAGGRGGGAHTSSEWYDDTHGARGMERLLRLVLALAA
jgi:tripeptide aminopeptidase